jgi:hypothetical protein
MINFKKAQKRLIISIVSGIILIGLISFLISSQDLGKGGIGDKEEIKSESSNFQVTTSYIESNINFTISELGGGKIKVDWVWNDFYDAVLNSVQTGKLAEADLSLNLIDKNNVLFSKTYEICNKITTEKIDGIDLSTSIYNFTCSKDENIKQIKTDLTNYSNIPFILDKSIAQPKDVPSFLSKSGSFNLTLPYGAFGYKITGDFLKLGFGTAVFTLTPTTLSDNNSYSRIGNFTVDYTLGGTNLSYDVTLMVNNIPYAQKNSVNGSTDSLTVNVSLVNGIYLWWLNATNGTTEGSVIRTITIEKTPQIVDIRIYNSSNRYNRSYLTSSTDNLIGWYKFDNNWTIQKDSGSFGNNLTSDNAVFTANGKIGGAYIFNGINSVITKSCPIGMAFIDKLGGYCIDKYEAVPLNADGTWNSSMDDNLTREGNTTNLISNGGYAGSIPGKYPWVYINQTQARTACATAGKYLCTSDEWLAAANFQGKLYNLPATISACTISTNCILGNNLGPNNGDACYGGAMANCTSSEGVYDMTGNVWEWTNETMNTNKSNLCNNATTGWCYINSATMNWQTSSTSPKYGNDGTYFLGNASTNRAVLRGGNWPNGARVGPFCVDLDLAPSDVGLSIGFRCCSGQLIV